MPIGGTTIETVRPNSINWNTYTPSFIPGLSLVDTGCDEVSDSCLSCPIPQCILDIQLKRQLSYCRKGWGKYLYNKGFTQKEVARILHISTKTVRDIGNYTYSLNNQDIYKEYRNNQWLSDRVVDFRELDIINQEKEREIYRNRYGIEDNQEKEKKRKKKKKTNQGITYRINRTLVRNGS